MTERQNRELYAPKELQQDYSILREALETTYPSLYRFSDSLVMTKFLEDQYTSLNHPMTESKYYKIIAYTCARVNDEHLIPKPAKKYYQELKNSNHFFPFSLKIINRRFYVHKTSLLEGPLPVGSEILSINGHSVEEILSTLLPSIPSDGYIQTFNIRHLEDYSMTQNENLFDLNYPLFIEDTESFSIEFVSPDIKSQKQTVTVSGLNYQDYIEFYKQRIGYKAPLEFKYIQDSVAYLRISSFLKWHRDDFEQDFYSIYDSIFTELDQRATKNLKLDLRNNEGGDGTGERLLTYLMTKPYKHFAFAEEIFIGYPSVVDYLDNGEDLFFPDSIVYKTDSGMYRLKKEFYHYIPLLNEQIPNQKHFKGNLYVLMNGASGSMSTVVGSILRNSKRATFIGEESGGTMEGNTSLSYARMTLPNTKIRVEIPLTKTGLAVNFVKGRGVFPDYYITPTIEDIMNEVDTELVFTLDLIAFEK